MIKIFTGIVEEIGTVQGIKRGNNSFQINIAASKVLQDTKIGDSIAVDGVCLTVTEYKAGLFLADVMPETMDKTTLKLLKNGSQVNLERALRLSDRLGGHLMQGHIDGIGTIAKKDRNDIAIIFTINTSSAVLKYIVPKGSIAIDGISLTVIDVTSDYFTVSLIPHTAHLTTLGGKNEGKQVNLESDLIGRYVEKLIKTGDDTKLQKGFGMGFLSENGFL